LITVVYRNVLLQDEEQVAKRGQQLVEEGEARLAAGVLEQAHAVLLNPPPPSTKPLILRLSTRPLAGSPSRQTLPAPDHPPSGEPTPALSST